MRRWLSDYNEIDYGQRRLYNMSNKRKVCNALSLSTQKIIYNICSCYQTKNKIFWIIVALDDWRKVFYKFKIQDDLKWMGEK